MAKKFKLPLHILSIFLILFYVTPFYSAFSKTCYLEPSTEDVYIILDSLNTQFLPDHFRKSSNGLTPYTSNGINITGLKELNISGSAQFSEFNLPLIITAIGKYPITIVDLRQESHGFINGFPISWSNKENNVNEGLTREEVLQIEQANLASIKINESITFNDFNNAPLKSIVVKTVKSEFDVAKSNNLSYLRVPVTDVKLPTDNMVDFFIESVNNLPKDSWLHFHCKHGIGRTSTFMIMYDMMKNAKNVPMNDIIQRQLLLANFNDKEIQLFLKPERTKFLENFYNYCKINSSFNETWSHWKATNKVNNNSLSIYANIIVNKNKNKILH